MSLYTIDNEIKAVLDSGIDPETGEINQEAIDQLNSLNVKRNDKMENIGCYIKNLAYEISDLENEEKNLKARRQSKEKKIEFLKNLVASSLIANGEKKFETAKVSLSFRKSVQVVLTDEINNLDTKYIKENVTRSADKTKIKKDIKDGIEVNGAELQERLNLQVS